MPTVAYFTPAWPCSSAASGIATYVDRMVTGLRSTGWKSVILAGKLSTQSPQSPAPAESVRPFNRAERLVRRLQRHSGRETNYHGEAVARSFASLVRRYPIDLIEMEESFGWAETVAARVPVPVVVRLHGPWCVSGAVTEHSDAPAFLKRVHCEGDALRKCFVSSPSQFALEQVKAYYRNPLTNAMVIPNPLSSQDEDAVHDAVRIPDLTGRVILCVSRFEFLKGGDLAVLAFAELSRFNRDCHFVFIGPDRGICQTNGTRIDLKAFVAQHFPQDHSHQFHFLGQQSPAVVRAWRSRADAVIVTSRQENFPMAILEALQAGKPVVASAVGGISEMIQHGVTGLLVTPNSVAALVQAIQRILDDTSLGRRLGENARRDALDRFSLEKIVSKTLGFYDNILREQSK